MGNAKEETGGSALKVLLAGSALSLGGVLLTGVFNYFLRRTLALELPPEDYGFVYSAISLATLAFVLTEFGMAQALTIETAACAAAGDLAPARRLFSELLLLKLAASTLLFAFIALLAPRFMSGESGKLFLCAFLPLWSLSAFYNLENMPRGVLLGLKAYKTLNACEALKSALTLVCVCLAVSGWGIRAPALIMPFFVAANAVAMTALASKLGVGLERPASPGPGWARGMAKRLGWLAASAALLAAPSYTDTLALTAFAGLQEAALYNIAVPLMQLAQGLLMIFPAVFLPIAAELWRKGDAAQLRRFFKLASLFGLLACAGALASLYFLGPFAIRVLFDARFEAAALPAAILTAGIALFALGSFFIQILNGGLRAKDGFFAALGGIAVNIAGHLLITPRFGVTGAAATTAATYLTVCALASLFAWRAVSER